MFTRAVQTMRGAVTVAQLIQYTRDQLIALSRTDLPTDTVCSRVRQLFRHCGCRAGDHVKSRRRRIYHISVVDDGGIPIITSNGSADRHRHGHRTMSPPRCCSGPVLCVGYRNDRRRNSDRHNASSSTLSWQPSSALITLMTRPTSTFNIGQLNARSLGNKASAVCTVLTCSASSSRGTTLPTLQVSSLPRRQVLLVWSSLYKFTFTLLLLLLYYVEKARLRRGGKSSNCNHGGICVFIRSNFKVRNVQLPVYKSYEALLVAVHYGGISLSILTIFRPPPAATDEFFREFGEALELCSKYTHFYVVGDVNIHLDESSSFLAEKFSRVVSVFGLRDCVDWRKWATFTRADFINALNQSAIVVNPPSDVDEFFACYDKTISSLLDTPAPFIDVKNYSRTKSPWYDRDCHNMKLQTTRFEKAYRRRPSVTTLSAWRSQFQRQRALLQRKFSEYSSHAISSTGNCLRNRPISNLS